MADGSREVKLPVPIPLFVVFLILKLTHVIDWSWWWITAPVWVPFALVAVVGFVAALFGSRASIGQR